MWLWNWRSLCVSKGAILFLCLLPGTCQTTGKPPLLLRPLDALLEYHRKEGTHIDGPRCIFYPSCAAYAQKAIDQHGFVGFWLLLDRLFYRESGLLYLKYFRTPRRLSKSLRYYDPVEDSLPVLGHNRPSFLRENFNHHKGIYNTTWD